MKCGYCGSEVQFNSERCKMCGARVERPEEPYYSEEAPGFDMGEASPRGLGTNGRACPRCGADVPLRYAKCMNCGANVGRSPASALLVIGAALIAFGIITFYSAHERFKKAEAEATQTAERFDAIELPTISEYSAFAEEQTKDTSAIEGSVEVLSRELVEKDGKYFLKIEFKWTNPFKVETSFFMKYNVEVYQAGVECGIGYIWDGNLDEFGNFNGLADYTNALPGASYTFKKCYELRNHDDDAQLVVKQGISSPIVCVDETIPLK